jgi:hypothetical protein
MQEALEKFYSGGKDSRLKRIETGVVSHSIIP